MEAVQKTDGRLTALLKQGGRIGFRCEKKIRKVLCHGEEVPVEETGGLWVVEYACEEPLFVEIYYQE